MYKTTGFFKFAVFFICAGVFLSASAISYAGDASIAESFGLYTKAVDYYHGGDLVMAKELLQQAVDLDPEPVL